MLLHCRAQFRIEISKLKIKSDLLTLKNTHHKGRYSLIEYLNLFSYFFEGNIRFLEENPISESSQSENI
jgi:hypothetical protein